MPEMTSFPPGTITWVELMTPDEKGARTFYTSLFGWTPNDMPIPGDGNYLMFQIDGKNAAAAMEGKHGHPAWTSFVSVPSADDAAAKAKSLGGTLIKEPFDVMDLGRMAIVQDPTGAVIAIWEVKKTNGFLWGDVGAACWIELATKDTATAGEFYTSLFGWTTKVNKDSPMEYTEFHAQGKGVGGMYAITPEMGGMPPNWIPYFRVEDCDASAAKAKSLGGSLMFDPKDIPNVGRFTMITDPQGAMFAIIKTAM
jgi:predicted enzyme related to lactoylglutathione lyase